MWYLQSDIKAFKAAGEANIQYSHFYNLDQSLYIAYYIHEEGLQVKCFKDNKTIGDSAEINATHTKTLLAISTHTPDPQMNLVYLQVKAQVLDVQLK